MTPRSNSRERALAAAQGVWRNGGTKKQGVEAGWRILREETPLGYPPQMPGEAQKPTIPLAYVPITTPQQAQLLADYLADYGNYPVGMSLCEAAGINGDAAERCPFLGEDSCHCDGGN